MKIVNLEQSIESGLDRASEPILEIGKALRSIRDKKLYREEGYSSFEAYLQERWEMSRNKGYQLIAAANILEDLSEAFEQKLLPKSESALRPLTPLSKIQRIAVWKAALQHSKRPGRGIVIQVIKEVMG